MAKNKKSKKKKRQNEKKQKLIIAIVIISIITILISLSSFHSWQKKANLSLENDEILKQAIKNAGEIKSYSQHVETQTVVNRNPLNIIGDYDINYPNESFKSYSKNIISQGKDKYIFSLTNISIKDDIYLKIETESELIKSRMPETNKWRRFKAKKIPERYQNIAVHGSIVDNLRLFSKDGRYVTPIKKESDGSYILKLSNQALSQKARQSLGTIIERIGPNGIIKIWVDKKTQNISKIEIKNPPYQSITTLSNINNAPPINPPTI